MFNSLIPRSFSLCDVFFFFCFTLCYGLCRFPPLHAILRLLPSSSRCIFASLDELHVVSTSDVFYCTALSALHAGLCVSSIRLFHGVSFYILICSSASNVSNTLLHDAYGSFLSPRADSMLSIPLCIYYCHIKYSSRSFSIGGSCVWILL